MSLSIKLRILNKQLTISFQEETKIVLISLLLRKSNCLEYGHKMMPFKFIKD